MLETWRISRKGAITKQLTRAYHMSKCARADTKRLNSAIWQEFRENHRPTWAEINLNHVAHNVKSLRSNLPKSATLIAVVKADGYGHGAEWVGKAALEAGAQRLAVATLEEGICLRRSPLVGKDVEIQILGLSAPGTEKSLLAHGLIPTVADLASIQRFVQANTRLRKPGPFKYHLKVDTGMGRIGLLPSSLDALLDSIPNSNIAEMEGVFTHFSKADESDKTHTKQQMKLFRTCLEKLKSREKLPKMIHSANSAGIIDASMIYKHEDFEAGLNTFRMGISLYGFWPSKDVDMNAVHGLKPIMSWKTEIVQLKELSPGHTISYGGEYITQEAKGTKIATLPVGYADGYRRYLGSNKPHSPPFKVLVRGKYAPIVGRVCMDMCHIDVSHIEEVKQGDEVVLIGASGDNVITADHMAAKLKTINYEISCLVGKRVPRLYEKDGKFIALKSLISDSHSETDTGSKNAE